ncbi:MAG: hypothetical protein AAF847_17530 [Bacteroidota bacterium]
MKIKIVLPLIAFFALLFASCEKDELTQLDQVTEQSEEALSNAPVVDVLPKEVLTVATIKTNGHALFFDDLGEAGIVLREQLPSTEDDPASLLDEFGENVHPFEVFVALTTDEVAVPQSIAKTVDAATLAATQRTVDTDNTPFVSDDTTIKTLEDRSCYDEGFSGFRSRRCGITSSFTNDFKFCDNGRWYSNTRNSFFANYWRTVKNIDTWTNTICGLTTLEYHYYYNNRWYKYYSAELPNGVWRLIIHNSNYRYRRVVRNNSGGSFRAYARFYR